MGKKIEWFLFVFYSYLHLFHGVNGEKNSLSLLGDNSDSRECRGYHSLDNQTSTEICNFVKSTDDCQFDEGFVDYIKYALCDVKPKLLPAVCVLYALWLLFLFIALGTTAESFFCPALEFIAYNLRLSQNIAGITVVAFGNGAPDIFSAVAAFTNSNPSSSGVAIGALLGAGVFVTTIVAGSVVITRPFQLAQRPFLRDIVFYIATVFWTFCLLFKQEIDLKNSIGFILLYVVYVVVVLAGRYINQKIRQRKNNNSVQDKLDESSPLLGNESGDETSSVDTSDQGDWTQQPIRSTHEHEKGMKDSAMPPVINSAKDEDSVREANFTAAGKFWSLVNPVNRTEWNEMSLIFKLIEIVQVPIKFLCNLTVPVVSADPEVNDWSRTLACLHCVTSPLFCVFATKGAFVTLGNVLPLWAFFLLLGTVLAVVVFFTSKELERPKYYWVFAYVGFISSILWTYCVANEIVNLLQTFGALINVSNVIMGLTFLAWGNSIGDTVADVTLAKQGLPQMAISACFGGPFFNLVIGIGLPCTIATISNGGTIKVQFTLLEAFLVGSLLFSLLFSFVMVPLRRFKMARAYGIILIIMYVIYLPVILLTGLDVIH